MSYEFSLSTERTSLIGTETFRDHFVNSLKLSKNRIQILSGYVNINGVRWLEKQLDNKSINVTIITQWNEQNLIDGSCDLESYLISKNNNWTFKILNNLHAKVALFDDDILYIGSGNLTGKGMALVPVSNSELGIAVKPTPKDISLISKLVNQSTTVDENMYNQLKNWLDKQDIKQKIKYEKFPYEIRNVLNQDYNKLWVSNFLWCTYEELQMNNLDNDDLINRKEHDFRILGIDKFDHDMIKDTFNELHVYKWLIESLQKQENKSLYFGELAKKIHDVLYDDPKPYRREVKDLQQNLYTFIEGLKINEIEITRPNYSQKIKLI